MQLHPLKLGRQAAKSQRGLRRVSFSDQQETRETAQGAARLAQFRLEPVQAAAFEPLEAEQHELASRVVATAALVRAWSHRREKRRAAHTDSLPAALPVAEPLGGDSDDSEPEDMPSTVPEDGHTMEEGFAYKVGPRCVAQ